MTDLKRAANQFAASAAAAPAIDRIPLLPEGDRIVLVEHRKRDVTFHLTPYAKGCEMSPAGSRQRHLQIWNRRPGQALDALFKRLEVDPRHAAVTGMENGEPAIHPTGRPRQPWAFAWGGLTVDEATQALDRLKALRSAA